MACESLGLEAGREFCLNWDDLLIPAGLAGLGGPGCVPRPGKLSPSKGMVGHLSGSLFPWSSRCGLAALVFPLWRREPV